MSHVAPHAKLNFYVRQIYNRPRADAVHRKRRRKSFARDRQDPGSRRSRRANHLASRTLPQRIFLPQGRRGAVRSCRAHPGPATEAVAQVAKERKIVLVASLFERRVAGVYHNTCAVLDADGSFLGKYRKMHIPDDPLYYEKFYFTPGDLGFPNFNTKYGKIGVQICWDQWYPEGSRLTALSGAQVIFYPTSIGWHPKEKAEFGAAQLDAWRTIQRAHAIANGVYVAVVNRVGYEGNPAAGDPGLEFWGNSFVADPFGQFVAEASDDKEEILVVECDPAKSEDTRRNWPFLRDRRIDAYGPLTNRWLGE
jgi:N-carbamoylputrescine amidase